MATIVVSYRGTDEGIATRIAEALAAHFGEGTVSAWDAEAASGGIDKGAVIVAMIGPRWLGPIINGRASIYQPVDPVRSCIEAALQSGAPIVPVTIGGSRLPRVSELPETIKAFAAKRGIEVAFGRNFSSQMEQVIDAIKSSRCADCIEPTKAAVAPPPSPPPASEPVVATAASYLPDAVGPAPMRTRDDRGSPEYWMHHAEVERGLKPGDAPLIMVSYANEDIGWVNDLQAFIDPKLEHLHDPGGEAYRLWQFSDGKAGTAALGDQFPSIIAEKMWRCRVAIIILSKSYFMSRFCRQIELPFLMWRHEHHGLFCVPLRLGALPTDRVRLPAYGTPSRQLFIDAMVDDRQAPADFASSPHRDLNLRQLRESGLESEIEARFDGIARLIVEFLRQQYAAIDA